MQHGCGDHLALYERGYSGQTVKLTIHMHPVLRSRVLRALIPLPHLQEMLTNRTKDNFIFAFTVTVDCCSELKTKRN